MSNSRPPEVNLNSQSSKQSSKDRSKVVRLNLVLTESNKDGCPVFNYESLIKAAQDVSSNLNQQVASKVFEAQRKTSNGNSPLFQSGNGKRKRCQTYTELGAGYDETDSFIDNTEACEEGMEEVQQKWEGYYINCENFDKEMVSDQSDVEDIKPKPHKRKRVADSSGGESNITTEELKKPVLPPIENQVVENDQKPVKKPKELEPKKKYEAKSVVEETVKVNEGPLKFEPSADGEAVPKVEVPENPPTLPHGLSSELRGIISELKELGSKTKENGRKFFTPEVKGLLLKLEVICRKELSSAWRHTAYSHLAHFLPCSKATLLARAKKLLYNNEDTNLKLKINKLKEIVDNIMPKLQENYAQRCQKMSLKSNSKTTIGLSTEDEKLKTQSTHFPRKTFPWNDEIRNSLKSIVQIKVRQYKLTHEKGQTLDVVMNKCVTEDILPIWPKGWMKTSSLNKQCFDAIQEEAKLLGVPYTNGPSQKNVKTSHTNSSSVLPSNNTSDTHIKKLKITEKQVHPSPSDSLLPLSIKSNVRIENEILTPLNAPSESDNAKLPLYNSTKVPFKKKKNIGEKSDSVHSETSVKFSKDVTFNNIEPSKPSTNTNLQTMKTGKPDEMSLHFCQKIEGLSNDMEQSVSADEAERKLHEETTAATDILSQLITDQNSHSQNIPGCAGDDKVQMQLNEVMHDLVVLNQMSADTVENTLDGNVC